MKRKARFCALIGLLVLGANPFAHAADNPFQTLMAIAGKLNALPKLDPAAVGQILGVAFRPEGQSADECKGECNFKASGAQGDFTDYYLINTDKFQRVYFFFKPQVRMADYLDGAAAAQASGAWKLEPAHRKQMKNTHIYSQDNFTLHFQASADAKQFIDQAWFSKN